MSVTFLTNVDKTELELKIREASENGGVENWDELKGKPFGESKVELLPETTFEFDHSGQAQYTLIGLIEDERYIVNWNGKEYECVCGVINYMGMDALCIGNTPAFMGTGDSGHPFVVGEVAVLGGSIIGCAAGEKSATISIKHLKIDTLNPKYIKDMYYTDEEFKTQATIFDGEINPDDNGLGLLVNMVKGEWFRVTINQKEYIREVQKATDSYGNVLLVLGNLNVFEYSVGSTGEPFVIFEMEGVSSETSIKTDNTIPDVFDLKIERVAIEEVVHPIKEKYLGLDWIPKKEIVATDTTVYAVRSTFSTGNTDHNVAYDSRSTMPALSEGRYYSVIYNDEEYVVRAEKITVDTQGELISLGNSQLYQNILIDVGIFVKNAKNTDEPFCIISAITIDGGTVLGHGKQMGDTYNITILEAEEKPNKLPQEYLDLDWIPTTEIVETEVLYDDYLEEDSFNSMFGSHAYMFANNIPEPTDFIIGEKYAITDNTGTHIAVATMGVDETDILFGDFDKLTQDGFTEPNCWYLTFSSHIDGFNGYCTNSDITGGVYLRVAKCEEKANKLPEKYIPDTIAKTSDLDKLSDTVNDLKVSGITWGDVEENESFGVTGTEDEPTDDNTGSEEEEKPTEPTTEYVTDNLAVYYDFTQYEDNYTGKVEDLSGNGVVPDIINLEYSYSGRGGFLGNKLMLGKTDLINATDTKVKLGLSTDAVKTYPFTVEVYAHLRKDYNDTLPDGELGYGGTTLPGQWNMNVFCNRYASIDATAVSLNGIDGRATENLVGIHGSVNQPNFATNQATVDLIIDGFNNSNIGEEYHHLVYCIDSNSQQVYLDGLLVLDTEEKSCTMTSNGYLRLFDLELQADLKMLRVYNDILSEYEVYTNYQSVVGSAYSISTLSETETETESAITRKNIKELDNFPVTMARAVYMNNSNITVEDEIEALKKGVPSADVGSVIVKAVTNENGEVLFKNSRGVTVFKVDLAQMNVGALQLPRIYLNGDTTNMGKDSAVPMKFRYVDNDTLVEAMADTEWQGNTSLVFPIKNYGFDLYSDEALTENLKTSFLSHMETDSYHLKANYIDPSNVKNLAGARLFDYVCKTIGLALPNGSRCVVDGIPVEVYVNNKFNGIYTLNYKQSKSLFGMGDGEAEFIYRCEDGTGWGLFSGTSFPTKEEFDLIWEARYPKPDKLTHHNEIQRMLKWVNDATDDEFKTNYAQYLNIDSVLAYNICGDIMAWLDNSAKNLTVCSWDGLVWYTIPYDMDMGMCEVEASGMINAGGNLWTKLNNNFAEEKKAMYKTLRDNGMNANTIFGLYSDIIYSIGLNGYIADKKIKYVPYRNLDSRISFTEFDDYITYHKEFIKQRIELMDTKYGYTAS